jgi:CelD/BcsL family acetyltransferase involved in cellulose biosynthesis
VLAGLTPRASTLPGMEPELTVDVVCDLAGVAGLEADFARLQTATGNALPFALFEWQIVWCRHFLRCDRGIVDQPMFYVVRSQEDVCVAILPMILTRRRAGGLDVAYIGPLGADPAITEIRTPLVHPGYEEQAARALHRALSQSREWDWIEWSGERDRFGSAIGRLRSLHWQPMPSSYVLDLPPTWAELHAGLRRNIRESLRHCYNSLKRDGHTFELNVALTAIEVREALERLFVLHSMRADMQGSVEHPDRFAGMHVRLFMHEVCHALAARQVVRVFELRIAGRVVASRIGFVVGDSLYLYYSGFDPAWSRFGVMTTTLAEAIKYAIALGLKTVNLSAGTDQSKTRWGPREVGHQSAYDFSGKLRSRLAHHAYAKARSGEGLQGWLLKRLIAGRRVWD